MAAKKVPARDEIDEQLDVWVREIPDLDRLTEGIIERIGILNYNINLGMDQTLEEYELDRRSFGLLGKLRRIGKPYRASAGKLAMDLRLSSGALTNRRASSGDCPTRTTAAGRSSSRRSSATPSGTRPSARRPAARTATRMSSPRPRRSSSTTCSAR